MQLQINYTQKPFSKTDLIPVDSLGPLIWVASILIRIRYCSQYDTVTFVYLAGIPGDAFR